MKVCTYHHHSFGQTFIPGQPMLLERLTFEAFKNAYGGGPAVQPPDHAGPPDGFTLWRTGKGDLMAIRDEG